LYPQLAANDLLPQSTVFMSKILHRPSARRECAIQELHSDIVALPPFKSALERSPALRNFKLEFGRHDVCPRDLKLGAAQGDVPDNTPNRHVAILKPDKGIENGF
jgi:hypothetical protein